MESLIKDKTEENFFTFPIVNFDGETGDCSLTGESFIENTTEYFGELFEWLKEYAEEGGDIQFSINLTYFNTSSSKALFSLVSLLKELQDNGTEVTLEWHYQESDFEMEDDIMDYKFETGMEIDMKAY